MKAIFKVLIAVVVILVIAFSIGAYAFLNNALAPLEQRVDTKSIEYPRLETVAITANTFNGNIEIQTTTNNTIEVTFRTQAPEGHLDEVIGSTINDLAPAASTGDVLRGLTIQADLSNSTHIRGNYKADIIIKLPASSKYNLTLNTDNGNIVKPQIDNNVVAARTGNGNIDIRDNSASKIIAQSGNGNINLGLLQGTLFQVNALSGNGKVTHEGIAMTTTIENNAHLTGVSTQGPGNLNITASVGNGNIALYYYT
jgi:DUF4097 and DUF4098 domain-containing protein YvlB